MKNVKLKYSLMWIFLLSFVGICFSGFLAFSEIFKKTCLLGTCTQSVGGVPSCVYGFVLFLAIFISSWIGLFYLRGDGMDEVDDSTEDDGDLDDGGDEKESDSVVEPEVVDVVEKGDG
jgi:hypothetical protein